MVMEPVYVTRDELMTALDVKISAYMHTEVDRACRAGSRAAEGFLHRIFYPEVRTLTFDYPRPGGGRTGRIWFGERQLITLSSLTSGGQAIDPGSVLLYPSEGEAPPYNRLELDREGAAAFSGGTQQSVSITGTWGQRLDLAAAGTIAGSINASTGVLSATQPVDVGSIVQVDSERMVVFARSYAVSGATASSLAANKGDTLITVSGAAQSWVTGEMILMDGERMRVEEITGTGIIVTRAYATSVLSAHLAGTGIQRQTLLSVERGYLGTAAAAHTGGAALSVWQPPSLVKELAQAYAEDMFLQRNSGYARTVGTGDSERQVSGRGIKEIENRARAKYGRSVRHAAV